MDREGDDAPIFLGDLLTAAGYRLAGARVLTPPLGEAAQAFERACERAPLVLVTAEYAAVIGSRGRPGRALVAVVPDARGRLAPPDPGARLRRELGLDP
jgi:vacuolar-type H+-ATPase subunit F/Vma7